MGDISGGRGLRLWDDVVSGGVDDGRGGIGGGGRGFEGNMSGWWVMRWINTSAAPPFCAGFDSWASKRGS